MVPSRLPSRSGTIGGVASTSPQDGERRQRPRVDRLRRPHKRRAEAGQTTGLLDDQASDLPSWLQERGVAVVPVSRLLSLSVAGVALVVGFGLVLASHALPDSYGFVIFGVQLLFLFSWTLVLKPAGPRVVVAVGLATAAAADVAAVWPEKASLAPLGYVTVAAFILGVVGQLLRGAQRTKATESLAATLMVVVGEIAFASLIVLNRHPGGTNASVACLVAAGVAMVVARLTDVVVAAPRSSPQVPRGSLGVVLGAMAGTAAAAWAGTILVGPSPSKLAIAGFVTATAAVLADLAVSYAESGRELAGEPSSWWLARHLQGPLCGYALAAPAAYVLSVMILLPGL
jgi:hypothetical protein